MIDYSNTPTQNRKRDGTDKSWVDLEYIGNGVWQPRSPENRASEMMSFHGGNKNKLKKGLELFGALIKLKHNL